MSSVKLNVVTLVDNKESIAPQIFFEHSFESQVQPYSAEVTPSAKSYFRYKNYGTVLVAETVDEVNEGLNPAPAAPQV